MTPWGFVFFFVPLFILTSCALPTIETANVSDGGASTRAAGAHGRSSANGWPSSTIKAAGQRRAHVPAREKNARCSVLFRLRSARRSMRPERAGYAHACMHTCSRSLGWMGLVVVSPTMHLAIYTWLSWFNSRFFSHVLFHQKLGLG